MLGSLVVFFWSLASTMRAQMRGTRVSPAHARLRVSVFGAVFLGAAIFVLGTSLSPGYASGPLVLAALVFLFRVLGEVRVTPVALSPRRR